MHFAIGDQLRVWMVIDRNIKLALGVPGADARGAGLDGIAAAVPRAHPQGHAVPARAAARPRLLPVAQAPRGELRRTGDPGRGARRACARSRQPLRHCHVGGDRRVGRQWGRGPGSWGAGASRMCSVRVRAPGSRRRRDVHRRRRLRRRGAAHGEGADDARTISRAGCWRRSRRRSSAPAPSPDAVEGFAHGMTVGTNALLTERGARTALVATRGFADLLEIARQDRPQLYHLCAPKPAPLVAERDRIEAAERVGPRRGDRARSTEERARRAGRRGRAGSTPSRSRSACSSPISSPPTSARSPSACAPSCPASTSRPRTRCWPSFASTSAARPRSSTPTSRRCSTATSGASREAASERGLPEPAVMMSSGGVAPAAEAARAGAWSVLSGPAGGAVGAGLLAELSGDGNALGFDMGGTSCDVCVVEAGRVRRTDSREIGGRVIQLPMVDVHTVGAGGGSIGWRDDGGALRVGPRSAGAEPGPACYGRGGEQPTVTDANLLLGYLSADSTLAGGVELDAGAAEAAVGRLAAELGIEPLAAAEGIVRVANQRDGPGAAGGHGRARDRPAGLRSDAVRRRRADARGGDRRRARDRAAALPAGERGALGARAARLRAPPRRRPHGDAARRRAHRGAARERGRCPARAPGRGPRGGAHRGHLRAALPRPGVRAAGRGRRATPDPDELAELFAAEHERRYGYRDPEAPSRAGRRSASR